MFTTNDFDKGYQDGLTQAREGKKKHYFNFNKFKIFFFSNALDTFIDGLREKHLVHKTELLISDEQREQIKQQIETEIRKEKNTVDRNSGMGGAMNPIIDNQIETLRSLKAFLQHFNESLQSAAEQYQKFLDDLADCQLDAQIYNRQSEFQDETKKRIYDIISTIEENDIPYIERITSHLEETPR